MSIELPPRQMPSVSALARYWCFRCLTCDSSNEDCSARSNAADHYRYFAFCDPGEPECMRCQKFTGYTEEVARRFGERRHRLVRAHIQPRWRLAIGGAEGIEPAMVDAPENILLLCEHCHKRDPEPRTRQEYLDWICDYRDRKYALLDLVHLAVKEFGIDSPHVRATISAIFETRVDADECAKAVIAAFRQRG